MTELPDRLCADRPPQMTPAEQTAWEQKIYDGYILDDEDD